MDVAGPVSGLFTQPERLRASHYCNLSCQIEAMESGLSAESSIVEAHFDQSGSVELRIRCEECRVCCVYDTVESLSDMLNRREFARDVIWTSIPTCAQEVCERCFYEQESPECYIWCLI